MSNLLIVYKNLTDSTSTLVASSTSGSLVASNMKTNLKSQVHRSTGTSVSYTLTWSTSQKIGCVALPTTNLSKTATMRVRLYSDTGMSTLVADSGTGLAHNTVIPIEWSTGMNANTFPMGGYTRAAKYFTSQPSNIRAVLIDLIDSSNLTGYIDCARIVCGEYWSSTYNFTNGTSTERSEAVNVSRTLAGDALIDRGHVIDTISFTFSLIPQADREVLNRILGYVGQHKNFWISLVPANSSDELISAYSLYGRLPNSYSISQRNYLYYDNTLTVESW